MLDLPVDIDDSTRDWVYSRSADGSRLGSRAVGNDGLDKGHAREIPEFLKAFDVRSGAATFAYEREAQLWAAKWHGENAVVRRLDPVRQFPPGEANVVAARRWIHEYLAALATTPVSTPLPLEAFDGDTLCVAEGAVWEILSYVPGEPIAWADRPTMRDVGVFLATFHEATTRIPIPGQRPGAVPLSLIPSTLINAPWKQLTSDQEAAAKLVALAAALGEHLAAIEPAPWPEMPIHGDATTMNILALDARLDGGGIIDFGGAYVENHVADIAFGLWQSGRPEPRARHINYDRVCDLVAGYASVRPLPEAAAQAIPVYMMARGLQMVAKRVPYGVVYLGGLELIEWLQVHLDELADALSATLRV